jgi:hypothetical protein
VAVELVLGIALLVVPVALVVLSLPRWSECQATARVVAREVARRAARDGWCDDEGARAVARETALNLGLREDALTVALGCRDGTALEPGSDVEVRVTVAMPAVQLPVVGAVGAWSWTAGHAEPVDRYVAAR